MGIGSKNKLMEIFTVRRNRNAALASEIVMFFQQFCGVNTIAYYSTEMFIQIGFNEQPALAASLGFGVINWLFAIPGMYTIDTFGRRKLLLTTFPVRPPLLIPEAKNGKKLSAVGLWANKLVYFS